MTVDLHTPCTGSGGERVQIIRHRRVAAAAGVAALAALGIAAATTGSADAHTTPNRSNRTASPIKHLVVIFNENVSYDHYFGTYPKAKNTDGTRFVATSSTQEQQPRQLAAADVQPQRVLPDTAHARQGADLRSEPRLPARAEGIQQRRYGQVRAERFGRHLFR